ncbi:MAG: DUF427 domain-containing protein [Alphaproteobacteria bacterium]|jgi:uncharacterized protein (DUF427 family)|nr:DUF427 domain-containing protein [Alphaproteobacteria bacterium]MDP6516880.1 DUF427 domain-containing protein [Alphaproteobacteria bacterium]
MSGVGSTNSGPGFAKHPGYRVAIARCPKRVRAMFAGETVVDSTAAVLVLESRHTPVYYFPRADVRMDLLRRTDHDSYCPFKATASYWTMAVGDATAENAVWSYEDPYDEVAGLENMLGFYWDRMDGWWEEDEEIFVHPRDPHVRLDILASRREVVVRLGGREVARSRRARFLFETGLITRYYLPAEDVVMDLLESSDSRTACPYKGTAHYWSARIDGTSYQDVAWSYPDPLEEAVRIKGLLCFYNDKVDEITVDGAPAPVIRSD